MSPPASSRPAAASTSFCLALSSARKLVTSVIWSGVRPSVVSRFTTRSSLRGRGRSSRSLVADGVAAAEDVTPPAAIQATASAAAKDCGLFMSPRSSTRKGRIVPGALRDGGKDAPGRPNAGHVTTAVNYLRRPSDRGSPVLAAHRGGDITLIVVVVAIP